MTLNDLAAGLLTIGVQVSHYHALKQPDKYIVWAEDGQADSGSGDNRMTTQVQTGTVDYFTKQENDPNVAAIQAVLNGLDLAWRFNSVQYEDKTRFLHHEWAWEMVADG